MAKMTEKNFIFLAGHHRSGTSLLHGILREHPLVSGFSKTGVPKDEGQHLQSVYEPAKNYGGPGKYIFNKNAYMNETHSLATIESAETIMEQWAPYYDSSCPYYIEKSPPNLIRTRFLQKIFPNSKFVIILRHPLAVGYATQKWSRTSIKSLIEHTLQGYEIFMKDQAHLHDSYVLRYEDFVDSPQKEINKIFDFLCLEPVSIRHKIRPDVNEKYFSMWRARKKNPIKRLFFSTTNTMEARANKFGYSLVKYNRLLPSSILSAHNNQVQPTT